MDRVPRDAGGLQLITVGTPEIEVRPLAGLPGEPLRERVLVVAFPAERVDDLFPHLATTRPERWADRDDEIVGTGAVGASQSIHGMHDDPPHGAPPSGMHGRHDTLPPIGQEDRRTVGDAHDERQLGIVADDCVRFGTTRRRLSAG